MRPKRIIVVTTGAVALGLIVIVVAVVVLQGPFREQWYLSRLGSTDSDVREKAAAELGDVGSLKAIPYLLQAFTLTMRDVEEKSGTSPFVPMEALYRQTTSRRPLRSGGRSRIRVAGSTARQKMTRQFTLLGIQTALIQRRIEAASAELLNSGKSYQALVQIATRSSPAALPHLERELENENWLIRWVAIHILKELRAQAESAAGVVAEAARDDNAHVRHAAIYVAAKLLGLSEDPGPVLLPSVPTNRTGGSRRRRGFR